MKDLEYRLWDKYEKRMLYEQAYSASHLFLSLNGKIYFITTDGYMSDASNRYDVMLYIGKEDCEGNKIFEGDVVQLNSTFGLDYKYKGYNKLVVVFDNRIAGFNTYIQDRNGIGIIVNFDTGFLQTPDNFKVIGNIYEYIFPDEELKSIDYKKMLKGE